MRHECIDSEVHRALDRYYSLYNQVAYALKQHLVIDIVGFEHASEATQAPFRSLHVVLGILVADEAAFVELVHRVIGQVRESSRVAR